MNKQLYFILPAFLISIALIIFLLTPAPSSSPKSTNLKTCQTLSFSGEGAVSLVFFSEKSEAEKYSNYLFKEISPFKENKDSFNVYYITNYKPECELYQGIATLCYSKELTEKASSCPNDYIVVLDEQQSSIRSSSYMNVLSINKAHQLSVFPHELGHAFANLAEEYVPAKLPRSQQNCVKNCDDFNGINQDCEQGCSESDYYRSVNSGIMRTLSSDTYGTFNENLIQKLINTQINTITGQAVSTPENCEEQYYYLIEAINENSKLKILSKSIRQGCIGKNGYGPDKAEILDEQNNSLTTSAFNSELIFTDAPGEEEINGETFVSDKPFFIKVPIIENSNKLKITTQTRDEIQIKNEGNTPCKV